MVLGRSVLITTVALWAIAPSSDLGANDQVDRLLATLPSDEMVCVWVTEDTRSERFWVDDLVASQRWQRVLQNPARTIRVHAQDSFAQRLALRRFPVCLLLAADGTELGRLHGGGDVRNFCQRLTEIVRAAGIYLRYRESGTTNEVTDLYWLGVFHWQRGERSRAAEWFERFDTDACGDTDRSLQSKILYRLGEHALDVGRWEKASGLLEKARDLAPDAEHSARCALAQARAFRRRGQTQLAIECLENQLDREPVSAIQDRLLFMLAYLRLESGERSLASRRFAELSRSFPQSRYAQRAQHYLRSADLPETLPDDDPEPPQPQPRHAPTPVPAPPPIAPMPLISGDVRSIDT